MQNLVHAFNTLPKEDKPRLTVFSGSPEAVQQLRELTKYPDIVIPKSLSYSPLENFINRVSNRVLKKAIIDKEFQGLDLVFPVFEARETGRSKLLFWIPDFQEHYLPEFFSAEEIARRIHHKKKMTKIQGDRNQKMHKFYQLFKMKLKTVFLMRCTTT